MCMRTETICIACIDINPREKINTDQETKDKIRELSELLFCPVSMSKDLAEDEIKESTEDETEKTTENAMGESQKETKEPVWLKKYGWYYFRAQTLYGRQFRLGFYEGDLPVSSLREMTESSDKEPESVLKKETKWFFDDDSDSIDASKSDIQALDRELASMKKQQRE